VRRQQFTPGEEFERAFIRLMADLSHEAGGAERYALAKERAFGRWGDAPDEDLTVNKTLYPVLSEVRAKRPAFPVGLRARLERAHRYACLYCGTRSDLLVLDHIVALVRGGRHDESNLTPACQLCNGGKHDLKLPGWLARRPDLSEADIRRRWLEARGDAPLPGLDP